MKLHGLVVLNYTFIHVFRESERRGGGGGGGIGGLDRQTDRQTDNQRDRQTDRQIERNKQTNKDSCRCSSSLWFLVLVLSCQADWFRLCAKAANGREYHDSNPPTSLSSTGVSDFTLLLTWEPGEYSIPFQVLG